MMLLDAAVNWSSYTVLIQYGRQKPFLYKKYRTIRRRSRKIYTMHLRMRTLTKWKTKMVANQ